MDCIRGEHMRVTLSHVSPSLPQCPPSALGILGLSVKQCHSTRQTTLENEYFCTNISTRLKWLLGWATVFIQFPAQSFPREIPDGSWHSLAPRFVSVTTSATGGASSGNFIVKFQTVDHLAEHWRVFLERNIKFVISLDPTDTVEG